ncbi:hypothetical protein [Candidatus Nanohalococcus occultus]|uniref:Uncharacterized protein n=1 Tax=Candidatus Nanohalococcus occultus TaxID=2978047 RepID=A0ABY8CF30_9ARCH|nr:hypothetical protein SVXNc_0826 [Candidatus Nanohaloarchaeota archaeon SVXNc]
MKAQTQALTTVLITTVVIGAAASTYIWGQPIIDKQESQSDIDGLERQVTEIHSLVDDVSRSGSNHRSNMEISLTQGSLEVNDEGNYIQVTAPAENSPYAPGWTLIEGNARQNVSIWGGDFASEESSPGVIAVKTTESRASDTIEYRIEFRNRRTGEGLERVELSPVGRTTGTGDFTLSLTNRGRSIDSSYEISTGETFQLTKTVVEVDIQ